MGCTITLDTYPDRFTSTDEFIESDDYENEVRYFVVKTSWLASYAFNTWGLTLDDFLEGNTWDDNWQLYEMAKQTGNLISERIEKR